jgi:hypothetical protein
MTRCDAAANRPVPRLSTDARARSWVGWTALWCAAASAGFGYAAVRAEWRLAASLPAAWEGRDLEVVGSIKGLPSREGNGARFYSTSNRPLRRLLHLPLGLWLRLPPRRRSIFHG